MCFSRHLPLHLNPDKAVEVKAGTVTITDLTRDDFGVMASDSDVGQGWIDACFQATVHYCEELCPKSTIPLPDCERCLEHTAGDLGTDGVFGSVLEEESGLR